MIANENGSSEELFHATLQGDYDDEAAWDAVAALRLRGTQEVFQMAVRYCQSAVPLERARGLDVLAQLGASRPIEERPHFDECVSLAIKFLYDPDSLVLNSAAWALAHLGGESAISALIAMRKNPAPEVRWAVANGLNGSERDDAIATVIELMDDPDDNVRDWATFALGTQCKADCAQIREALRKRLNDTYKNVRDEAVWGLAQHKDAQGMRMLVERLSAEHWIAGDEMAAAEILDMPHDAAAQDLLAGLQKLLDA
jgi:HEAT repeat protein